MVLGGENEEQISERPTDAERVQCSHADLDVDFLALPETEGVLRHHVGERLHDLKGFNIWTIDPAEKNLLLRLAEDK